VVVLGNLLIGVGEALKLVLMVYSWILVLWAILSWVRVDRRHPFVRFLHAATEPVLGVVRRRLPAGLRDFPIDLAFLVLFAIVIVLRQAVAQSLVDIGLQMRGSRLP
jgi:YggT family protein